MAPATHPRRPPAGLIRGVRVRRLRTHPTGSLRSAEPTGIDNRRRTTNQSAAADDGHRRRRHGGRSRKKGDPGLRGEARDRPKGAPDWGRSGAPYLIAVSLASGLGGPPSADTARDRCIDSDSPQRAHYAIRSSLRSNLPSDTIATLSGVGGFVAVFFASGP